MAAITPIVMPKWGLEMREGTVQDWLVREGERIEVGTALLDVDTDKISNAVEAPDAGLLRRIVAQSGETLPVKALLGVLAEKDVSDAEIDAYVAAFEVPAADSDDEDAGPAFDYAEVDGIRVRYARRGPESGTPVLFIHGDRDRVIRCPAAGAEVVRGAGHLMNLTHADVVNRFLLERIAPTTA